MKRRKVLVVSIVVAIGLLTGSAAKACDINFENCFNPYNFNPYYNSFSFVNPFGYQGSIALRNFFFLQQQNAFSNGTSAYSGINTINAQISAITGIPFVPIQSPFPANYPAAASNNLNGLLGLFGMQLPFQ